MVLQPFSIPEHIEKIKSGEKTQTTRKGIRDLRPGTKLQQYYRPRMKKSCVNCISETCRNSVLNNHLEWPVILCMGHVNFLGEVPITEITHYPVGLQELNKTEFEKWALCDGFENAEQAEEWFETQYGIGWRQMHMTVIKWDNSKRVMK